MKALLNDEGKRLWGYVFPDGEVPIQGINSHKVRIGDLGGEIDVYLVDWGALTAEQRSLILRHLKNRFVSSEVAVEAEILKSGLPLRAALVSCVPIPGRFF